MESILTLWPTHFYMRMLSTLILVQAHMFQHKLAQCNGARAKRARLLRANPCWDTYGVWSKLLPIFGIICYWLDSIWNQLHVDKMTATHSDVCLGPTVCAIDMRQPLITPSLWELLSAVTLIVDNFRQSEKPNLCGFSFFRAPTVATGGATHNSTKLHLVKHTQADTN